MPSPTLNLPAQIPVESMLAQMPGYFLWKDIDSNYLAGNLNTAKLFGFDDVDKLNGITDYDINCSAAQFAHLFLAQDEKLKLKKDPILVLDVHPYVNGEYKVLLINKSIFYNDMGEPLGITCYCTEVKQEIIVEMSLKLAKTDTFISNQKESVHYYLDDHYAGLTLSTRQEQCLFYLLRGKTAAQTGELLHISRRTVESHIDFVKEKMQVRKKPDLIGKAFALGYHEIVPRGILGSSLTKILQDPNA